MTQIEQMIKDMCPHGVEYKKLGEVAEIDTGNRNRQDAVEDGQYPFYVRSKEIFRIDSYSYNEEAIIIPGEGGIGDIFHYVNGKYDLHQRAYRIHLTNKAVDTKFVYFYLTAHFKDYIVGKAVAATVTSIRKPMLQAFEIPVPPIEIQQRIVAILDKFSALAAELQAELHLRRKQYEYYRTQLLTPHSDCNSADNTDDAQWEWKKITDIADTFIGLATSVTKYKRPRGILLLHNSDIKDGRIELKSIEHLDTDFVLKNSSKILHTDDIITVHTGDVGTSAVISPEFDGTIGFTTISSRIKDKTIVTPAYLCKILNSEFCKNAIASKTISDRNNLNLASFDELIIPIPPLAEQARIVSILDKFEALTTSLSDGIPAEQAAQQKQYEYYRDKLLTFEKRP